MNMTKPHNEPGTAFARLCIVFSLILWLLLNISQAQNVKQRLDSNDYLTSGFFTDPDNGQILGRHDDFSPHGR